MRLPVLLALTTTIFVSCKDSEQSIIVTETRPLTLYDQKYPGDIHDRPPLEWRRIPSTRFRAVNFVAGENDTVEIFMGNSRGNIIANANRWLGQFGAEPKASREDFPTVEILGASSALIEAEGNYTPGMGAPDAESYALVGAIRATGDEVLTFKMVGPIQEVSKLREDFLTYCTSLTFHSPASIDSPES